MTERPRRTARSVTESPVLNSSARARDGGNRRATREVNEDNLNDSGTPDRSPGNSLKLTRNALIARMKELEVHNERRWWRAPIPGWENSIYL